MFGLDFWEMVVILVIALLVVGPERLPKLARTTGLWVGKLKRMASNLREELEEEIEAAELKQILNQQQKEINELRDMLQDTRIEPRESIAAKVPATAGLPDPRMQAVEAQLTAAPAVTAAPTPTPSITPPAAPAHDEPGEPKQS